MIVSSYYSRQNTSVPVFALFIELDYGTPLQVVAIISPSRSETTTIFISLAITDEY